MNDPYLRPRPWAEISTTDVAPSDKALPPCGIAVVLGTRPELIKLSPLIRLLGPTARIIHTGQHFDPVLTEILPEPLTAPVHARLRTGGAHRGVQIGQATAQLTDQWLNDLPAAVVVQGDTNTALAGALAANACDLPLVHVEAGLRSHDRNMPEEHNRVLIDHLADLCCAATPGNVTNLLAENIPAHRIALTGNPIIEALTETPRDHSGAHHILGDLAAQTYILATVHRPENVDDPDRLSRILHALAHIGPPVLFACHPRTCERAHRFGLDPLLRLLHIIEPPPYPTFLALAERAKLLISDSGGIQEEVSILKKPLLILRRSTERPEVLGTFARLVPEPEQLIKFTEPKFKCFNEIIIEIQSPFGDGNAACRIVALVKIILELPRRRTGSIFQANRAR